MGTYKSEREHEQSRSRTEESSHPAPRSDKHMPVVSMTWLRKCMLIGITLGLFLIGGSLLLYPSIAQGTRLLSIALLIIALLCYGGISIIVTWKAGPARQAALQEGTRFGILIGGIWMFHLVLESLIDMGRTASTISSLSIFVLIFLLYGVTGWRGARTSGRFLLGALAAVWSAMSSFLLLLPFAFLLTYILMPRLMQILATDYEYLHNSLRDLQAYSVYNSLISGSIHAIETVIVALLLGSLGA